MTTNLHDFIAALSLQSGRDAVADELQVLQSIYGDDAIRLRPDTTPEDTTLRYEILLNLPPPHDTTPLRISVSVPPTYPTSTAPQLQLLSRYLGPFAVDALLFGRVLRTYMSADGARWESGAVCVFDGVQWVVERCAEWYEERLAEEERRKEGRVEPQAPAPIPAPVPAPTVDEEIPALPEGVHIYEAEPITDRKSTFVGRACRISHPSHVPLILSHLASDRRISRATHPLIHAWRCRLGSVLHQDNDDDGETAAGARLAHLLHIMELDNVLVVVTRYYGGIHLGPDRFKHINQAARSALELGILDLGEVKRGAGKTKRG